MSDVDAVGQGRISGPPSIAYPASSYAAPGFPLMPRMRAPAVNEIATICELTLICTQPPDIHLSDLGYQKLADLVFAASGY